MATKTSTQVETELNDLLYESTVNDAPWTQAVKRRALNRAIRESFPNFKIMVRNNSAITLAASTYVYSLSALTDLEDLGGYAVCRVRLEPSSTTTHDYHLLRTVTQFFDGTNWQIRVPERIVESYAGKKLEIFYYKRVPELDWTGGAADVLNTRYVNFVVHKAAVYLIRLFMQGGSDFNVDLYPQLLRDYEVEAENALHKNTDYQIPLMVGVRQETDVPYRKPR